MNKNFYITTTLPYVNADPHIGFAMEIIKADAIARYKRSKGYKVFFNTGTDEHGLKIYLKALEAKKDPKEYCDYYADVFKGLKEKLNLSFNSFTRTTDENHIKAAQEFWMRCFNNGFIYKSKYPIKYCVGCESEKQDSELVNGKCPLHPNLELTISEDENYFFKYSLFTEKLLDLYKSNLVIPEFKLNEIRNFVVQGLKDFSISRLKSKMPWGIPVPNDSEHVMYVWFDALVNYISCLGWPNGEDFNNFWPGVQICGKDNNRFQSAMWQAMLMAAGVPNSKQILVEGFINNNGVKMSKSLGNTVDPLEIVNEHGVDVLRYYLLAESTTFGDDWDYTEEGFKNRINGDLANGLGNLIARVTKMVENSGKNYKLQIANYKLGDLEEKIEKLMEDYRIDEALVLFREEVSKLDKEIQEKKPWENLEINTEFLQVTLGKVLYLLKLFSWVFPTTKDKVWSELRISDEGNLDGKVTLVTGLFPRIG